jgi:hypothetical protein
MSSTPERFDPPWERPEWQAEAIEWIEQRLAEKGLSMSGPIEQPHIRAWSTVLRIPTEQGLVFFKAGAPVQAFEPGLLKLLNERRPDDVLPLIAVDVERGWSLLPEGGKTLRTALQGNPGIEAWQVILPEYAALQIAAGDWTEELLKTGMPDQRLHLLPARYKEILTDVEINLVNEREDGLSDVQFQRLVDLSSTVTQMVEDLKSAGIPASLEHGDLHDANVFALEGQYRIFDWGDASLTHPFFTMLIPLRIIADKLGLSEYDPAPPLTRLRDAYLRTWLDFAAFDKLVTTWDLAHHVSKFVKATSWYRMIKATSPERATEYTSSVSGWLLEFLAHPTQRF